MYTDKRINQIPFTQLLISSISCPELRLHGTTSLNYMFLWSVFKYISPLARFLQNSIQIHTEMQRTSGTFQNNKHILLYQLNRIKKTQRWPEGLASRSYKGKRNNRNVFWDCLIPEWGPMTKPRAWGLREHCWLKRKWCITSAFRWMLYCQLVPL